MANRRRWHGRRGGAPRPAGEIGRPLDPVRGATVVAPLTAYRARMSASGRVLAALRAPSGQGRP